MLEESTQIFGRVSSDWSRSNQEDPELATSLHNLATLHHHREEYDLAEPLYRRALALREAALGRSDPAVGMSLNHLAALYRGRGEYDTAIPLYDKAIAISETALGRDHRDVGAMCNNLAAIFRLKGDYARARPLYERSLRIAEKALGKDHTRRGHHRQQTARPRPRHRVARRGGRPLTALARPVREGPGEGPPRSRRHTSSSGARRIR